MTSAPMNLGLDLCQLNKRVLFLLLLAAFTVCYAFYSLNICKLSNLESSGVEGTPGGEDEEEYFALNPVAPDNAKVVYADNYSIVQPSSSSLSNKYRFLHTQGLKALRKLPEALIIGVKKCGTRALLEFIRVHPDVRAAGSEVHFFDRFYKRGFEWYRLRMPPTLEGQVTMEKTPSYFVTKEVPERVHQLNPAVKLLIVVRDPVTRAISDYTQASSKRSGMRRFEDLAFINGTTGLVDTSWGPVRIGVYVRHLERWLRYFPLEQILFVSGEQLITDPAAELLRVQNFLGLKQVITEKHFYFNQTKGFPCLMKAEGSAGPHCLGKTKGRNHPLIKMSVIQRLREFYRPFNARLYQITGINFGWP